MEINRKALSKVQWPTRQGHLLPISDLGDKALQEAIQDVQVNGGTGNYPHLLLSAEQTFRNAERA